jgi:hypothetical protein
MLSQLAVFSGTLTREQAAALAAAEVPKPLPAAPVDDTRCLDVLSMMDKSLRVMPTDAVRALASQPSVLEAVLRLCFAPVFNARMAATRIAASLLPSADPAAVDTQVSKLAPLFRTHQVAEGRGDAPSKPSLISELLLSVGEVLTSAIEHPAEATKAVEGAESAFALTAQRLSLLRALAKAGAWAPHLHEALGQALAAVPAVLQGLERALVDELQTGSLPAGGAPRERQLVTAAMAMLGGYTSGVSVGAEVLVELDKKGVFEEATVLALTHAPAPKRDADR